MNYTFFFLPALLEFNKEQSEYPRNAGQTPEQSEIVISHPLHEASIPTCPFCNVERCAPLDFCYVIKSRLYDTPREYCGSLTDLTTIVRDRLANHITNNACQPAVADLNTAYCWCQNSSSRMVNNLLYPIENVVGRIDHFNKMLLDRLRGGADSIWSSSSVFRRLCPLVLLSLLIVYLFMGSACFWALEHEANNISHRKWYLNQAVSRRNFARSISSRIFNDTRNLLIIIDREQTERVQQLLVESLKRYEEKLDIRIPGKTEWNFLNSFNYAYGLLLTLGHGAKVPGTTFGQIFALVYCLLGIPLFYATVGFCAFALLHPFLATTARKQSQRLLVLYLIVALYLVWGLLVSFFLYYWVSDHFWSCVFTAFLAGLTVQIPLYSALTSTGLLALLGACSVSVTILSMITILLSSIYCCTAKKDALLAPGTPEPQKFTIIVDEAGDSKLAEPSH